ncbi:MAG: F0F1 ATP synthase subunit A [Coriobacteriia bacterium]|nr:F0F1 ATP synthase subunit A [Coriobacteriia bacterium]
MEAYDPLSNFAYEISKLLHVQGPVSIFGPYSADWTTPLEFTITGHLFWWIISVTIFLLVMFAWKKRASIVPRGRFVNAMDFLWEFIRKGVVETIISHNARQHLPFISTIFFLLLVNNYVGVFPSAKAPNGVISGTLAMSVTVFIYFNYAGIKAKGGLAYFKGIVPHGVPVFVAPIIFIIEVVSFCLRPITQALRLFAAVYAGHILLGIFALLTSLFVTGIFQGAYVWGLTVPLWFVLLIAIYVLEFLVLAIQAYVFTMLTAVYIDGATSDH